MSGPQIVSNRSAALRRRNPLAEDISTTGGLLRTKSSTGKRKLRSDEDANGDGYIDALSSRKILAIAQELADEDDEDRKAVAKAVAPNPAFAFDSRFADQENDTEDVQTATYSEGDEWRPDEDVEDEDIDPADMAVYNKFLSKGEQLADFAPSIAKLSTIDRRKDNTEEREEAEEEGATTNLADLILQRIAEKEALTSAQSSGRPLVHGGGPLQDAVEIPANVAEVFEKWVITFTVSRQLLTSISIADAPLSSRGTNLALYRNRSKSSQLFRPGTCSFLSPALTPGHLTPPLPQPKSSSLPSPQSPSTSSRQSSLIASNKISTKIAS